MAEDKKPDPNLDDWDNLPLDPASDDWDDIPPPSEKNADDSTPPAPEPFPSSDDFAAQSPADFSQERVRDNPAIPPDEDFGGGFDLDGVDSDFDAPPDDDFDSPAAPDDGLDLHLDLPPAALELDETLDSPASAPDDGFDSTDVPPTSLEDDFDSPISNDDQDPVGVPSAAESLDTDAPADDDDDFAAIMKGESAQSPAVEDEDIPFPNVSEPKPPTKKVELDIDGIFPDEDEEPSTEPEDEAAPEEEEEDIPEDVPAEEEEAENVEVELVRKKVPKIKLLLIIIPAVLILAGLVFGVYKLFIAKDEPEYVPPPLTISPNLPVREPHPGELRLESFYINFPGRPNDTIVEVSMVLHFEDTADELAIVDGLVTIRDIIYRITQSKGNQIITNSELQRALREELRTRANLALGGDHVSYVQINQIRILQ
ncbi:hypothetical protein C4J81_12280 [Deltaproteobacteria bacterium Smac51]|nr:hypothetical protein C4J81_12280 [Deltaproteobacteria bacterium Smac51]